MKEQRGFLFRPTASTKQMNEQYYSRSFLTRLSDRVAPYATRAGVVHALHSALCPNDMSRIGCPRTYTSVLRDLTMLSNTGFLPAPQAALPGKDKTKEEEIRLERSLETALKNCRCHWKRCTRSCASWELLKKHADEAHCKRALPGAFKPQGTASRPAKVYVCNWEGCSRRNFGYPSSHQLSEHVQWMHLDDLKAACPICKYKGSSVLNTIKHLRTHRAEQPPRSYLPMPLPPAALDPLPDVVPPWHMFIHPVVPSNMVEASMVPPPPHSPIQAWDVDDISERKPPVGKRMFSSFDGKSPPQALPPSFMLKVSRAEPRDKRAVEVRGQVSRWEEPKVGWEVMKHKGVSNLLREGSEGVPAAVPKVHAHGEDEESEDDQDSGPKGRKRRRPEDDERQGRESKRRKDR